ncbi:hypothetical protein [Absidia glauca]|uniref:HMG box domain-containing protein n=1 Tax=Absidia glauca TaxID=4829 RepID=A0A163JG73_ABSGL|nr:hypothetical protein [Absidia glauca]
MDDEHREKYIRLKRRIRDIERENDFLHVRIHKASKSVKRLRLERAFLLDRIEKYSNQESLDESESDEHTDHEQTTSTTVPAINPKTTKLKKKKDPNAPKGPGNVFFLFCRLQRDKIKDEHPEERSLGEVTKLLSAKWKELDKDEKKVYQDMYQKELEDYEVAMKSYNNTLNQRTGGDEDSVMVRTVSSPAP